MVIRHLKSKFSQILGEDVFYIHEKLKVDECKTLIKYFNNANFQEKVMLASTKTYSEGLNLVGASRVVLLDIMQNPSMERQAFSHAYKLRQEKVVYNYHLITSRTIEEKRYFHQVKKERQLDLVFDCKNKRGRHQKVVFVTQMTKRLKFWKIIHHVQKQKVVFLT